ncbi:MAG: DUF4406 domain-containing protein, partial [Elusimicrobia bacterium]|nr:DUF4406 domain-containing protein [Elusimicrobiota bacterium]
MYKIYIAGAITNNPNYVKEFLQAEEALEKKGFKVLSPLRTQATENALPPKFCFFDCLDLLKQADMMLFSTHADDEHLWFAGLLPTYVDRGYDIQVVYFTNHLD